MKKFTAILVILLVTSGFAFGQISANPVGSWKYKGLTCSVGEPSPDYAADKMTYIINHKPNRTYDSVYVIGSNWVVTKGLFQVQRSQICYRIEQAQNNSGDPIYLGDSCSYAVFTENTMTWRYISRGLKNGCESGSEATVLFEKQQDSQDSDRP